MSLAAVLELALSSVGTCQQIFKEEIGGHSTLVDLRTRW
jgi:hypothetical protein